MKQARLTINFFIKPTKVNADGKVPIYVRLTIDGVRKEMATNLKIEPKQWNQKFGRIEGNKKLGLEINKRLEIINLNLLEIFNGMVLQNKRPTPADIISSYLGKDITPKKEHIENHISNKKNYKAIVCRKNILYLRQQ